MEKTKLHRILLSDYESLNLFITNSMTESMKRNPEELYKSLEPNIMEVIKASILMAYMGEVLSLFGTHDESNILSESIDGYRDDRNQLRKLPGLAEYPIKLHVRSLSIMIEYFEELLDYFNDIINDKSLEKPESLIQRLNIKN